MRVLKPIIAIFLLITAILLWDKEETPVLLPIPTEGDPILENVDETENQSRRAAWFELMHRTTEGVDWRQLEYRNRYRRHIKRGQAVDFRSDCAEEFIADGNVKGFWRERGNTNQAGSVLDVAYDPVADQLWLIAAGGSLWRGSRDGSDWTLVNQDLQFDPGLLRFIEHSGRFRLIAFSGRIPHYSDDGGYTWVPASGVSYEDSYGAFKDPVVIDDFKHTIYFLAKAAAWEPVQLYRSADSGESYEVVQTFLTNNFHDITLNKTHLSNDLFVIQRSNSGEADVFLIDLLSNEVQRVDSEEKALDFGPAPVNMVSIFLDSLTRFYAYTEEDGQTQLYYSEDLQEDGWSLKGEMPARPWEAGIHIAPSNPEVLFFGEVECFKSVDQGASWEVVNNWWEYYEDIGSALHADIMEINAFKTADGESFMVISNHGGLSISTDLFETQRNIALSGLNINQFYSVRTDAFDKNYIYAGSQDQGLQIADDAQDQEMLVMDQIIPGDYGHLVFTNNRRSLWATYPDGLVMFYEDAQSGSLTASYDLSSVDETVWLAPLMESPDPAANVIYMAGGNLEGGQGSYMIRLEYENDELQATQSDFDFKLESAGGTISALAYSPVNPDIWYVATTNGRVFYSTDAGNSWEQSLNFLPEGHYLYGQKLYPSKIDEKTVFLGGSGYANPPLLRSTDGGASFQAFANDLPPTLVLDITGTPDESLLFAATEAGPYVYLKEDNRWYDLAGQCAPAQAYWSVEYLPATSTVRFGTYGRGIWDFSLDQETSIDEREPIANKVKIYPNPSDGPVNIQIEGLQAKWVAFYLTDVSGRMIEHSLVNDKSFLNYQVVRDWSSLPSGLYFLRIEAEGQQLVKRIILTTDE